MINPDAGASAMTRPETDRLKWLLTAVSVTLTALFVLALASQY